MEPSVRVNKENEGEEDIGFIMWKLESIGNFYPCYKKMIEQE